MKSKFLPKVDKEDWDYTLEHEEFARLHDLMVQPLHFELYKRQNFEFMDELSEGQQMMVGYDYIQSQVLQGGFIQLIQNHYISLLLPVINGLKKIGNHAMVNILDDVLKVYVLNRESLDAETSVKEFAELYQEFTEFESLDERFRSEDKGTQLQMTLYASTHPDDFVEFVRLS